MEQEQRDVFTVSRLAAEVRAMLETSFPLVWVAGEVSNLAKPRSGHLYFTLKDATAQVRCALFKNRKLLLRKPPEEGEEVLLRARISLYESRGDFQLIVEHLEPFGAGRLRLAFEQLKIRLHAEGLFEPELKLAIPRFPRRIGVVTSPTGAAIRDILQILRRRAPHIPVRIYPAQVQGPEAAADLIVALGQAQRDAACDVLILARGGGSLEDLAAFNEEELARAVVACNIPIISAIGHEIDFAISDFVADQRAPTPSAAAELVAMANTEILAQLATIHLRLNRAVTQHLVHRRSAMETLGKRLRLRHPKQRLQQGMQAVDDGELRIRQAFAKRRELIRQRVEVLENRLAVQNPYRSLIRYTAAYRSMASRLRNATLQQLRQYTDHVNNIGARLDAISPLATLNRGYAIAIRDRDSQVLRTFQQVQVGEAVSVRLARGSLACRVIHTIPPTNAADDSD